MEVLLQKRYDGGWRLPSSLMKLGESLADTAKRKIQEEIGLVISDLQLLSILI
uniref:NUDIX domain-containing protein n=1 Tax=Lysinibacillus sp. FSL H8-0500 TaxID=2921393 RepID=UPI004048D72D